MHERESERRPIELSSRKTGPDAAAVSCRDFPQSCIHTAQHQLEHPLVHWRSELHHQVNHLVAQGELPYIYFLHAPELFQHSPAGRQGDYDLYSIERLS